MFIHWAFFHGLYSKVEIKSKCVNCSQIHPSDSKLCLKWKLEKQTQEIKTNKNKSYFEAHKLIVPQITQTYVQATKPSTISTTTQTDPNITHIISPPLQYLKLVSSSNLTPNIPFSMPAVCTSSAQAHLLLSTSSVIPTIQNQSHLPIPISTTATLDSSLNTSASSLSTETRLFATTSNKFSALSTEVQPSVPLPESAAATSNSKPSDTSKIPKSVKQLKK
ncbi:uncharacterized protein TNCV_229921 [Trichonephila clavipes]|nr:uncharacterized protein TNCV_229921 [Trichonephila clavipes]